MATQLDLQEQEQLDQLKAFWAQYGNLISTLLIIGFGAIAAWNGWNWYQREQSVKAAAMFEELDKAASGGDAEKTARVFNDLKERFGGTVFAEQGGLLTAKVQVEKGDANGAKASLGWVAEHAKQEEYRTIARLRLAGVLADAKQYDEALKQLDGATARPFDALVADRRGDILLAQGKKEEAKAQYRKALEGLGPEAEYRRLVDAKLTSLGGSPLPADATAAAATAATAATAAAASATAASQPAAGASK